MTPDALLRIDQVAAITAMAETTIARRAKAGTFPKPVHNGRSVAWLASEIQAFIAALKQDRERRTA